MYFIRYCGGEIVVNIPEPSSDDYYDIGTKPGLHLIFSQENFFHHNTRTGTEADAVRLKKTFSLFGMDCVVFRDQTLDEIKQILKNGMHFVFQSILINSLYCLYIQISVSSTRDFAKDKMLIITVLTHGNEVNGVHKLYAKDREYDANLLWQSFSPSANTNLACKPKWVNIVACRGSKVDPGFLVHERTSTDGVGGQIANAYKLPMEADILISNSTDSGEFRFFFFFYYSKITSAIIFCNNFKLLQATTPSGTMSRGQCTSRHSATSLRNITPPVISLKC